MDWPMRRVRVEQRKTRSALLLPLTDRGILRVRESKFRRLGSGRSTLIRYKLSASIVDVVR